MVIAVVWCAAVIGMAVLTAHISWPWTPPFAVHVRFSATETWDYPAGMGEALIAADVAKRVAKLGRQELEWADGLSAAQKAECFANPTTRPSDARSVDCARLVFASAGFVPAVPNEWRTQLLSQPQPLHEVLIDALPRLIGPPLLLLILGAALSWVASGFGRT